MFVNRHDDNDLLVWMNAGGVKILLDMWQSLCHHHMVV